MKKVGKISKLDRPSLHRIILIFYLFQMVFENADPPNPLGSDSDIFEFENILMAEDPSDNILKGLFRHIYIEEEQIKCFNFSFLGWGLRITYN